MNWVLFSYLILLSVSAHAEERKYDFDKNGKTDFVEIYRNGKLVESHYDSDADGKFDRHVFLDPEAEVFKIVDQLPTKKQFRRRVTYWNSYPQKRTFVHVELDKNKDGIFEFSYDLSTTIDQTAETCTVGNATPGGERLAAQALAACARAEDYTETDFGYRVHNSCLQKPSFMNLIRESITTGMACLNTLSQQGMRGAARNVASLEGIFANGRVQVLCNESSYNWGTTTLAHATSGPENAERNLPLVHPGISLGPLVLNGNSPADLAQFKRTFFHEQLHNLGYRHGVEPEISYTCGKCCFPEADLSEEAKASACNACGGDYSGITDPDYLAAITEYGRLNYASDQARDATIAYLHENHNDNLGLTYFSANAGGLFSATGAELARILSERTDLSPREREIVAQARDRRDFYEPLNAYRPGGRAVAEAYIKLYHDRDPAGAMAILRQNATVIKANMAANSGEPAVFMAEELQDSVKTLIHDVWIGGYRGNAPTHQGPSDDVGMEAYNVRGLLGIN